MLLVLVVNVAADGSICNAEPEQRRTVDIEEFVPVPGKLGFNFINLYSLPMNIRDPACKV